MTKVALCADSVSLQHPECIGLAGEALAAQPWLRLFAGAQEARDYLRESRETNEVWVAGSDDVEGINLAAALKSDRRELKVCLLAFPATGSLCSRAQAAGLDEVLDQQRLAERYQAVKAEPMRSAKGAVIAHGPSADPSSFERRLTVLEGPRAAAHARQAEAFPSVQPPASAEKPMEVEENGLASWAQPPVLPVLVPALEKNAHVLTVVGAGGGVGKSTISVLAACIAQARGYRTVLVDADLQFGDIQYLTGADGAIDVGEALDSPGKLAALEPQGRMPAIIAAPARVEQSEKLAPQVSRLVESLRPRFDLVVVNTSPAWSDVQLNLLESGSNGLFVIDQRPSSIRACRHALELCARCGLATQPLLFAINRCSRSSLFSSIDVSCALQGVKVVEFAEGGRDVEELLGTGTPLELIDSGNALCASVARLLDEILPALSEDVHVPATPAPRRRLRISPRRKKAACL